MKIELPPPIPCKRERPPKHSEGKQPRVESQATASLGRTTEQLDEDRGPKAPEAPEREQKPAISEAAHRASPPPVPPPRSPKEAAREQAPSPTPPSFGKRKRQQFYLATIWLRNGTSRLSSCGPRYIVQPQVFITNDGWHRIAAARSFPNA